MGRLGGWRVTHYGLYVRADPRSCVNTAVFEGFACGANLHIPAWLKDPATPLQGWWILNLDEDRPDHGKLGIYVAALVTSPAEILDADQHGDAWPTNWAFFYAVESSTMTLEEFRSRTSVRTAILAPSRADG